MAFVDLQKAFDTVHHDLLWASLEATGYTGISPRMLAAILSAVTSLQSISTGKRVGGTAGLPLLRQNGMRQGALSALPCLVPLFMACMAICIALHRMLGSS